MTITSDESRTRAASGDVTVVVNDLARKRAILEAANFIAENGGEGEYELTEVSTGRGNTVFLFSVNDRVGSVSYPTGHIS